MELSQSSKEFFKKHKDKIDDIILFGSLRRGKDKPSDIDILMVFKDKVDKDIEYEFRKSLKDDNVSVLSKKKEDIFAESFDGREGILFEGFSLVKEKSVASDYGFKSFGMFLYKTSGMSNSLKTRFYYALNGRKSKGVLDSLEGIKMSDNVFIVPLDKIEPAKEFLEQWKLQYRHMPAIIPIRIAKKEFFVI